MKATLLFLLCGLTVQAVRADDVVPALTVDGVTYSNVTFGTVTPARVGIIYTGGITSLPLEKLSPELQKRFGYDPQKAEQFRQAEAQQRAIQDQRLAAERARLAAKQQAEQDAQVQQGKCKDAIPTGGKIVQVLQDGLLLDWKNGQMIFMKGQFPDAAQGQHVVYWSYRDGVFTYQSVLGASTTVERWIACEKATKMRPVPHNPGVLEYYR